MKPTSCFDKEQLGHPQKALYLIQIAAITQEQLGHGGRPALLYKR